MTWRRARSLQEAFAAAPQGMVIANTEGVFDVGPFVAATPNDPGYWFTVLESWFTGASPSGPVATPNYDEVPYGSPDYGPIGDVVFWNEYPDSKFGVNESNSLPKQAQQMQVNPTDTVYYSNKNTYPSTYDEATPYDDATPFVPDWIGPKWYAIDRYTQYQLGLLGTGFYQVDLTQYNDSPPDYKDL